MTNAEHPKGKPPLKSGTRTSAFGVGKREGHDSSPFYDRFHAPEISTDATIGTAETVNRIIVGDARDMGEIADNSVALAVTSPPYFAGKAYEEALGESHIPANYVVYRLMLRDVFAECARSAATRWADCGEWCQPRSASVSIAGRRRDDDSARPTASAVARRSGMGETTRCSRQLCVGQL